MTPPNFGRHFILVAWLLFSVLAHAGDEAPSSFNLRSTEEKTQNFLTLSFEQASFALPKGSLSGNGPKIEFNRFLNHSFSLDANFSTAFGSGGGLNPVFTGLGGYLTYVVFGNCCASRRTVSVNDHLAFEEKNDAGIVFQVGVGFDQFFLDGNASVYSASGFGAGGSLDFNLLHCRWRAAARASSMTANTQKTQAIFYSFGLVLPL